MSANRSQLFYSGILTADSSFKNNSFEVNGSFFKTWKVKNDGPTNTLIVSWSGANDTKNETDVLPGEELSFKGLQASKVAVRSAAATTTCRVWAY